MRSKQQWVQTKAARRKLSALARSRELQRLAQRAGCSLDEAEQHRAIGERWCTEHSVWHASKCCPKCRKVWKATARRRRRQVQL